MVKRPQILRPLRTIPNILQFMWAIWLRRQVTILLTHWLFIFYLFFIFCVMHVYKGVCVLAYGHKDVCEFVPVYAVK